MNMLCDKCGTAYNDAGRWTICPHNPLDAGPRPEDFCIDHDMFGPCPICNPNTPREKLHSVTAAIWREEL